MPEGYLHLTCEQRCQIYALLQSGHSQAHIARQIGVDPSTISRELVRNTGARGYRFKQAHEKASQRREEASDKPRKMTPDLVELIEEKLTQEQWSPDQISGRLAKDGVAFISHERIYQHVWKDKKDGGTLYLHLRHSGKKYNRRKGKNSGRGLIPNRVDIDQRPPIVAAKSRIGDWEADTIIGANHKGVVMSHVERTSKYTKLAKLPDKNADSVVQACARVLLPLADRIETITYDNGVRYLSGPDAADVARQSIRVFGHDPDGGRSRSQVEGGLHSNLKNNPMQGGRLLTHLASALIVRSSAAISRRLAIASAV